MHENRRQRGDVAAEQQLALRSCFVFMVCVCVCVHGFNKTHTKISELCYSQLNSVAGVIRAISAHDCCVSYKIGMRTQN